MVQCVITETYIPVVLKLLHDEVLAGHPDKERTLSAAHRNQYGPTMRVDIEAYVAKCIKYAQQKGIVPKPAPILEYPPHE